MHGLYTAFFSAAPLTTTPSTNAIRLPAMRNLARRANRLTCRPIYDSGAFR